MLKRDEFTACYSPPPDFLLCRAKEVSAVPSETLHRRDAVSELPYNRSDGPTACFLLTAQVQ